MSLLKVFTFSFFLISALGTPISVNYASTKKMKKAKTKKKKKGKKTAQAVSLTVKNENTEVTVRPDTPRKIYYERRFYPHLSEPAKTIGHLNVSYDIFPGSNGATKWYHNALNIGIRDRFQIGTVPLLYVTDENHSFNINMKWNYYRTEVLQFAVGYSYFLNNFKDDFTFLNDQNEVESVSKLYLHYTSFIFNWLPRTSKFSYSFSFNFFNMKTDSQSLNAKINEDDFGTEYFLETSYIISEQFRITGGFGAHRTSPFQFSKSLPIGFGATLTYLRNTRWLNRFSGGLQYIPSTKDLIYLFSFSL